ncbi:TPA: DUF551 domain-containing protein [Klebsiella pneumoniae]|nr:DUF551 domain-containing protein [Klebsiella pneumoniae]
MTKSTITRERAQQIFLGNGPEQSASEERELARMTLVAMDSEPVAYIDKQWTLVYYVPPMSMGLKIGDKLYRHAQPVPELKPVGYLFISDQGAIVYSPTDWGMPGFRLVGQIYGDIDVESQPAPVVPDAATAIRACLSEFPESARDIVEECADIAENACRAAMLKAQPQSAPQNSPEIIPGWIPVSERVPESNGVYFGWDGKRVLEVNCFFGGFSANQFIHGEITHWMPLPAPPTEVK